MAAVEMKRYERGIIKEPRWTILTIAINKAVVCLVVLLCLCMASASFVGGHSLEKDGSPPALNQSHAQPFANQNDTGSHGSGGNTGTIDKQTTAQGRTRQYQLYVPSGIGSKPGPFPLFVYLHGAGYDKTQGAMFFGGRADTDSFIIASPSGDYQQSWREIYTTKGSTQTYYDSSLIRVILNETLPLYNIDLSNIWVGGWSDGGAMSLRAGSLMSDLLATVTHQTGGWGPDWANATWAVRKSMSFYSRVGDNDSGFLQDLQGAHDHFTQAGYNFNLEIIPSWGHGWRNENEDLFPDWEKTHTLPHNWIRPALSFNKPTAGAKWDAGTKQTVEWWLGCGNPSYQVKLELSTNGPSGPWTAIDTITQSNWGLHQYDWNIPGSTPATTNAVLRGTITDSSNPQKTNVSQMNYTFEIVAQSNLPPVVNAGSDQTIQLGAMAYLNGTATDPENDPLTINWSKQSGPGTVTFADPKVAKTTATFSVEGDYVLILEANDAKHAAVSDAVNVKVTPAPVINHPPVLSSIGDKIVAEGDRLAFTVQATDPDKDTITYTASVLPKNSVFEASTGKFAFDPDYNQSGDYTVTFSASDGKWGNDSESIKITVTNTNRVPVAKASAPQDVKVGEKVTLDGSASSDPDGDTLTYEWKQTSGPKVSLSGTTSQTTTFTPQQAATYVFQLVVRDPDSQSSPVKVAIVAKSTGGGGQTGVPSQPFDWSLPIIGATLISVAIIAILIIFMMRRRGRSNVYYYQQSQDAYWNQSTSIQGYEESYQGPPRY